MHTHTNKKKIKSLRFKKENDQTLSNEPFSPFSLVGILICPCNVFLVIEPQFWSLTLCYIVWKCFTGVCEMCESTGRKRVSPFLWALHHHLNTFCFFWEKNPQKWYRRGGRWHHPHGECHHDLLCSFDWLARSLCSWNARESVWELEGSNLDTAINTKTSWMAELTATSWTGNIHAPLKLIAVA